jgi:5-methylcytosine-specific restriction endonuclease McrA
MKLSSKVLVLNLDYNPITVCSVQRAFLLVFLEKADILRENQKNRLRTVNHSYPMPSVIKLKSYVSIPYKGVMLNRDNIFKRDRNACVYCGSKKDLTLDHVVPKARGGKTSWTNLVTACKRCNASKGDYTPEEAGLKLPYAPFKPSYIMFLKTFAGYDYQDWMPFLNGGDYTGLRAG